MVHSRIAVLWLIPFYLIEVAESHGGCGTNSFTTAWGQRRSMFPREFKVYDVWVQELSIGSEADICSRIVVPVTLHGRRQYLCLLSHARLNDSSASICGSAWHLDLMRKKCCAPMNLISSYTIFQNDCILKHARRVKLCTFLNQMHHLVQKHGLLLQYPCHLCKKDYAEAPSPTPVSRLSHMSSCWRICWRGAGWGTILICEIVGYLGDLGM